MLDKSDGTLVTRITHYPLSRWQKWCKPGSCRKEIPLMVLWPPFLNGTSLLSPVTPLLFHGDSFGPGILFWKPLDLIKTPTPPTLLNLGSTPLNSLITKKKSINSFQQKLKTTKIMSSYILCTASSFSIIPLNPATKWLTCSHPNLLFPGASEYFLSLKNRQPGAPLLHYSRLGQRCLCS